MAGEQGSSQGGSTSDAQAAAVAALEAGKSGGGQGSGPAATQQKAQPAAPAQSQQDGSGLANPFLEAVAPEDRPVVEKYIKDWDSNVSKKFQELHGKLEPWEQIGAEPEQVQQAMTLLHMIDEEPETVLSLLQEALGQGQPQGQEEQQQTPTGQEDDPMASLPPQFVEQFNQMREVLETLAGNHIEQQQSQQQAQEDAELDQMLTSLKEQYGDFDDDYVLAKIVAGKEPEEAVQAYQKAIQGQVNARATVPNVPAILGGGGAAPQTGGDIKKASSKDVRGLVANILAQAQQS